jgi:hypothetical protein
MATALLDASERCWWDHQAPTSRAHLRDIHVRDYHVRACEGIITQARTGAHRAAGAHTMRFSTVPKGGPVLLRAASKNNNPGTSRVIWPLEAVALPSSGVPEAPTVCGGGRSITAGNGRVRQPLGVHAPDSPPACTDTSLEWCGTRPERAPETEEEILADRIALLRFSQDQAFKHALPHTKPKVPSLQNLARVHVTSARMHRWDPYVCAPVLDAMRDVGCAG